MRKKSSPKSAFRKKWKSGRRATSNSPAAFPSELARFGICSVLEFFLFSFFFFFKYSWTFYALENFQFLQNDAENEVINYDGPSPKELLEKIYKVEKIQEVLRPRNVSKQQKKYRNT